MTSRSTTLSRARSAALRQKWSPHAFQKKGVKFLLEHGAAALFLDPGLGKTSITLAAFSFLKKRGVANKMLVIAPLRVCHQVWPAEAEKWTDFNHLRVVVLHGPRKDELLKEDADVYCINPEGLEWLIYGKNGGRGFDARRWRSLEFDTLAVDELTKFKHSKGVRFKALKNVLNSFARRWGLTGTPAANGLLDLFGQCYVLDLGNALGKFITHYRMNYFYNPDGMGWKWVPRPGAQEQIYEKLKPLALRMSAEDYLQLPPLEDIYINLELPPKVRKLYDTLEDDLVALANEKLIVAATAGAAGSKLWQICGGSVYADDDIASLVRGQKRGVVDLHDVKLDWLEELVDELQGQPLLVAYQFQHEIEKLQKRFGNRLAAFTGKGAADRELEAAWNNNELLMLAGQQDAISHGLNLQLGNAAHLAHYANTWNFETWDQIVRRIRRQGTKATRIRRYIPIMKDTTDEDRRWAMLHKDKGQKALFEALMSRRNKR